MFRAAPLPTVCQPGDREMREFFRIPVVIPVRVEIFPGSKVATFAAVLGTLLNIGRGGGMVRLRWEFPAQTHLFISLPVVGLPIFRFPAEVIWACHPLDGGPEPAAYGIRWVEPLSLAALESILMRQGLVRKREETHAPGP